jgi:hypothetical protein
MSMTSSKIHQICCTGLLSAAISLLTGPSMANTASAAESSLEPVAEEGQQQTSSERVFYRDGQQKRVSARTESAPIPQVTPPTAEGFSESSAETEISSEALAPAAPLESEAGNTPEEYVPEEVAPPTEEEPAAMMTSSDKQERGGMSISLLLSGAAGIIALLGGGIILILKLRRRVRVPKADIPPPPMDSKKQEEHSEARLHAAIEAMQRQQAGQPPPEETPQA